MSASPVTSGGEGASLVYDGAAFGAYVVGTGEVSETDWRLSREVARRNATSELRALLDLGLMSEASLADHLASWSGCDRWNPEGHDTPLDESTPLDFMRSSTIAVFCEDEEDSDPSYHIVVADPSDRHAWRATLSRFGPSLGRISVAPHKDIASFLDAQAEQDDASAGEGADELDVSGEISALRDMASEAPVVRFFNQSVERAMDLGASDIHLERFDRRVSLRYRVDGMLLEQPAPALQMYDPLLCRIKILSSLDIAERRRAQDGRIRMRLRGRQVDMRVSVVPTMYGQDAAIRLQDRAKLAGVDLSDLGFSDELIESVTRVASLSHGILLITGPTGSGKTTTLYAILKKLVTVERKIVTVEDPVEYAMDGVNQIQVNPAINLSFDNTLRHILRHDPDVVLIGEIRDAETAQIAFQASLTGHMVLSTLHTNDVPSTFVRLVDMGVEPYLVNAAVEGVAAQRLLRRMCPECGNTPERRSSCEACSGLGYKGRIALMEFSEMSPGIKRAMKAGAQEQELRMALQDSGFQTMRAEARRLVRDRVTDEAEITRVLGHPEAAEAVDG